MLQIIRAFFADKEVMEVETPILSSAANTDPHLQSFSTFFSKQKYFHNTSPEFFMKRLLASGSGDIYQICKVFRDDEQGRLHNPEFTMLEWYRLGFDHHQLMDEMEQLFKKVFDELNLNWKPVDRVTYKEAFLNKLGVDPLVASADELKKVTQQNEIEIPVGMDEHDKDQWLDWLITQAIAPSFSESGFTFVYDYPASQASLARLSEDDVRVAHRFEMFWGEVELANGFYELTNANEQAERFNAENTRRETLGLEKMPVDEKLLSALKSGLPDCSGVAVGLDRLLMVVASANDISEVISFSFERI